MFSIAILIGIYSYIVFILGILGLMHPSIVIVMTILLVLLAGYYLRREGELTKSSPVKLDNQSKLILGLIIVLSLVNLIGALGPELSFDALWYHLTIPKIFLHAHKIFHIPGSLFYYSDMPKLLDLIYVFPLSLGTEIAAKIIHFGFGLLSMTALFQLSRKYLNLKFALLAVLIFSTNLVFAWESTTSYIDLGLTFFEIMAFWGFMNWSEKKERKWLIEFSVILGLAICTKLTASGSLVIFAALLAYVERKNFGLAAKNIITMILTSLLIALPWFVFSTLNTGNPIFPLLTKYYPQTISAILLNPIFAAKTFLEILLHSPDPLSPIYIISIPLVIIAMKKFGPREKILLAYCAISFVIWYLTPQTGGGRFILPYLPAMSLLCVVSFNSLKNINLTRWMVGLSIILAVITIGYRGLANTRYVPVVLGFESKDEFLKHHLNFKFGDFYDTDGYFKNNIKSSDKVLLYGFHNLYYVDFPYIDSSYVMPGDKFNFVAVQNMDLPRRFELWHLVYQNPTTGVKLYSIGEGNWYY